MGGECLDPTVPFLGSFPSHGIPAAVPFLSTTSPTRQRKRKDEKRSVVAGASRAFLPPPSSDPTSRPGTRVQEAAGRSSSTFEVAMEEDLENRGGACPQLLDLIPNESDWMMAPEASGGGRGIGGLGDSEDKKLELKLGLPGGGGEEEAAVLCLDFFSKASKTTTTTSTGARRRLFEPAESKSEGPQQEQQAGFLQLQSRAESGNEWPHKAVWAGGKADLQQSHAAPGGAAGPNTSSQTRAAPAPVVGWPPIRSFRKNLSSSSVKPSVGLENDNVEIKQKFDNNKKGLLVKINMDGIPIGRKVDLKAYDNYEKLSLGVKELFLGLLAAQKDTPENENEAAKQAFVGLLDGSGEYTLVYEDNEGDKMLAGDVPWDMFVSTVKRLRVLKSSDLAALRLGAVSRKRTATES
ncbi:hypothetical protein C4D60_Mb03t17060 [Musa balbisiana]|uniref:Auxin-responsive protein n=1 Tax=Musa balbisiana TaxID=52838 RepID=A0A4S8JAK1_MUSBA|nr:hypothetical protein C4D60_Mb03t17060 [Musa balbisiana]